MVVANNQVLVWYKCLRKRTKLKMNYTRYVVYLSAPSCWLYSGRWQTWFSFLQQNKAHQNRTQISRAHILLQTSLTLSLLRDSCWNGISAQCTAVVGWEAAMMSVGVWADTLQSSWLTVAQLIHITEVMKVIPKLTVVILLCPCSIQIISILYQNNSRSWPSISCPSYSFDLRAELKRYRLKAL